jgi:DNA repair exonuclease SbcCD ATPase subunit
MHGEPTVISRIERLEQKTTFLENELEASRAREAGLKDVLARQQNEIARYLAGMESQDQVLGRIKSSLVRRIASKLHRWQKSSRQLRQRING